MEIIEDYLSRKYEELQLLNDCLVAPGPLRYPGSVNEVIDRKFHIAAALKGEHALHDWAHTETAWSHGQGAKAGPFRFTYDYQRADLTVDGPSFYEFAETAENETIYTSSGMAALSALLIACDKLIPQADVLALPGTYPETLEVIETYTPRLHLIRLKDALDKRVTALGRSQVLLFDSCTSSAVFEAVLRIEQPQLDLVIFDTTCFSSGSGRIRRVLRWARRGNVPIVLVRSHTKLDSLGVEYGRLGSAVFVDLGNRDDAFARGLIGPLTNEVRKAVRLFGGAALPAHFPPYVGTRAYRALTARRVAAILRNGRRTARFFATQIPNLTAELHFAHGLYITLMSGRSLDEKKTRQLVSQLCADMQDRGLPLRHAGSFGFDFGAAEWARDATHDRYVVRIAVPDLPTDFWGQVIRAVAQWWSDHEG